MKPFHSLLLGTGLALATSLVVGSMQASSKPSLAESDQRPALTSEQGTHSAMLDVTRAGERLVSVGERGLILLSDDNGQSWRQAQVPASVTFTAVHFVSPEQGWVAGHYGLVLHTSDGGESWQTQLTGQQAADLVLQDVRARTPVDAGMREKRALFSAQRLVQDGPDKPFLDIHFLNSQEGLVVGAYGLIFRTQDGGQSWQPINTHLRNPGERHLYSIAESNGRLFLAGEEGLLFRSQPDDVWQFDRLSTDYDGSFFTLSVQGDEVVVAGLRGNAFGSTDAGDSWQALNLPSEASVVASTLKPSGQVVLVNQAGQLMAGDLNGTAFDVLATQPGLAPTHVMTMNDQTLLLSGLQGLAQVSVSSSVSSN